MDCCVCSERLIDDARTLPCLHTLCRLCLGDVFRAALAASLRCPICAVPIPFATADDVPVNPFASYTSGGAANLVPSTTRPCKRHEDAELQFFCMTCNESLCALCVEEQTPCAKPLHVVLPETEAMDRMLPALRERKLTVRERLDETTVFIEVLQRKLSDVSANAIRVSEEINATFDAAVDDATACSSHAIGASDPLADDNPNARDISGAERVPLLLQLQTWTQADIKALELQLDEHRLYRQQCIDALAIADQICSCLQPTVS